MSTIEQFLAAPPLLHSWDGGNTWNTGGFSRRELEVLIDLVANEVGPGARVLETGAGCSTVAFLLAGAAQVTAIAPDQALFDRICAYCNDKLISILPLISKISLSEDCLPAIVAQMEEVALLNDLVLIDGGHGWPTVFVDFCYCFRSLRKGGFLIIDDIQLYSVKELARFLCMDPNVKMVKSLPKTLVFQKLTDRNQLPDFGGQPYIKKKTEDDQSAGAAFKL
jgi:precorrin-6B methylase 2